LVLKGKLTITTDDDEQELSENDAVYIPGYEPRIVAYPLKEPSIGIDIFVSGRSFDFWLKQKNP
jgi:quercetin dioxygenase-like cupin family protein